MSRPETITSEYVRGFRAGESSALERAAQEAEKCRTPSGLIRPAEVAEMLRAIASPAAAPATEHHIGDGCLGQLSADHMEKVAPSLLPRVLAALESQPFEHGTSLAAELRRYIATADRKPDPCQRCGRLGGHPVDFRFDGILMGSWICPHCLGAQEKRITELEGLLRECGETLTWITSEPGNGISPAWRDSLLARIAARTAARSEGEEK